MTCEPSLWDLQRAENPGHRKSGNIERFPCPRGVPVRTWWGGAPHRRWRRARRIPTPRCGFGRHAAWLHARARRRRVDGDDERSPTPEPSGRGDLAVRTSVNSTSRRSESRAPSTSSSAPATSSPSSRPALGSRCCAGWNSIWPHEGGWSSASAWTVTTRWPTSSPTPPSRAAVHSLHSTWELHPSTDDDDFVVAILGGPQRSSPGPHRQTARHPWRGHRAGPTDDPAARFAPGAF